MIMTMHPDLKPILEICDEKRRFGTERRYELIANIVFPVDDPNRNQYLQVCAVVQLANKEWAIKSFAHYVLLPSGLVIPQKGVEGWVAEGVLFPYPKSHLVNFTNLAVGHTIKCTQSIPEKGIFHMAWRKHSVCDFELKFNVFKKTIEPISLPHDEATLGILNKILDPDEVLAAMF